MGKPPWAVDVLVNNVGIDIERALEIIGLGEDAVYKARRSELATVTWPSGAVKVQVWREK